MQKILSINFAYLVAILGIYFNFIDGIIITASANDFNSELGAGGLVLVKSNSISMEREDLFLSEKEVRVRYEFRNITSSPVITRVAFPMPEMPHMNSGGPTTSAGEYNIAFPFPVTNPNFLNFKAWVNNRPIKPELEIRALLPNGRDISSELMNIGGMALMMRPGLFGNEEFNDEYGPIDINTRLSLKKLNAFVEVPEYEGYNLPWTVHVTYHWEQQFPPGITIIEHHYKPLVGGGFLAFDTQGEIIISGMENYKKNFCIDEPLSRSLKKYAQKNNRRLEDTQAYGSVLIMRYILQTARSWHGPIGTFHLTIQGETKTDRLNNTLISLCTDLPLRRTAKQRFETIVENYIPNADLRILFIKLPN